MGKTVILCLGEGDTVDEKLTLSRAEYESVGSPAVGTCLSGETLARIRRLASRRAALATALHILECGDTSRARLREKLIAKGHPGEAADAAVEAVTARGYIDEGRLASRQVALCAKKGWGRRRILAYLAARGIPASLVSDAIREAEASGEVDFAAMRRAFIDARRARGMSDAAIQRALWQAGF